jgi:DHA2 family multidrug resistance protein
LSDNLTWRWIFYVNLPICLLSLTLTMLYIHDPPYIRSQRPEHIDYLGLGLLCVGMGALQVLLDKGQLEDWFSSSYIWRLAAIAAIALIALIYRELKTEHPIIDLRLFKDRNYADGMTIVFIVTIVRSGSILLLPLFLQKLMGYDATTAGLALAFSGIGALLFSPVVGRMTSIIDSRVLLGVGLALNAYAVYLFGNFNTYIDFNLAWFPRLIQGFGSAATIVSLATLTMCCIPKDRMGSATGIYNMIGNLGSGFGVAVATTYLDRRAQFHQNRLVEHQTPYSLPFSAWQERLAELFQSSGDYWDIWESLGSLTQLYAQMKNQAWMKSFCDIYWIYTLIFLALIPLVLLMRHEPPPIQCPADGPQHESHGVN